MAFADDLSTLTSSGESWEISGVIMAAIVAVSVAGEVAHDFELFWSVNWWRAKGGKASGLVLVAALVAEVVIQINVTSINGLIIALLETEMARANERAVKIENNNLTLQRELEIEKRERLEVEEKYATRHFNEAQLKIIEVLKGRVVRANVRCVDEIEACLAAENFAKSLRSLGIEVPTIKGVGLRFPPLGNVGVQIFDPDGINGVFAQSMLHAIPNSYFLDTPFIIGDEPPDSTHPGIIVRLRAPLPFEKK